MRFTRSQSLPFLVAVSFPVISGLLPVGAISPDNAPSRDNSVAAEREQFQVHEEFQVELFADESLGIANPIAIHWDPRGRLWVLCTLAYAQLKPGEIPNDQLFVLEDTDGDGRADRSTVFAEGLVMPTGFALGHGGVYLAEGSDLIFLEDIDGDDRADSKKVLLSGFGTGDTHQNISNLIFDAGGFLYFTQGLHTFSQVETPWGVSRGDTAGFWRFDPRTLRLDPFGFPSMTSQNPCGVALDRWGALFIKSNGPHLCFATPGLIPTTHYRELMQFAQVGQTPGKSMGVEIVESSHLPDWIQGNAIIAGYFAREVSAIPLVPEGSGFARAAPVRLLYGGHESFRPVDIRQGPDGAIYVADWFNPIINHYQVSLRHPDRDYTHGRIWRISAKDRPPATPPNVETLEPEGLLPQLGSSEKWVREQTRRLLVDHSGGPRLADAIERFLLSVEPSDAENSLLLVEGAGVLESRGPVSDALLDHLQSSSDPYVRAVVPRIMGRSSEPRERDRDRLGSSLRDPHPRPRLEAVIACANRPGPESLPLALTALEEELDPFLDYALRQAVHSLESHWVNADTNASGEISNPDHLAFALETYGGPTSVQLAREALEGELANDHRVRLLAVLCSQGEPRDLERVFRFAHRNRNADLLEALAEAPGRPSSSLDGVLGELVGDEDPLVRIAAITLAGRWQTKELAAVIETTAKDSDKDPDERRAALENLAILLGKEATPVLLPYLDAAGENASVRPAALEALIRVDLPTACEWIAAAITKPENHQHLGTLVGPLLKRGDGLKSLAAVFEAPETSLDPETASALLTFLNLKGRIDEHLTPRLNGVLGITSGAPDYDPKRIAALVQSVRKGEGDPGRGREIYLRAELGCVACHRIGDAGGVIGPRLTTVGAGLPLDQIIESILWPGRQIKEGYQALSITRKDGRVITGYLEREGEDFLWYRNTTTPWILPLAREEIASRQAIATLMPPGLTRSLDETEFLDLVAYLASMKGAESAASDN